MTKHHKPQTRRSVQVAAAALAGVAILTTGLAGCAGQEPTTQAMVVTDQQAGTALKIAEWLGEEVAGAGVHIGVDSLFELLTGAEEGEDPNKERFEEVNTKLEALSEQLTVMQESVTTLIGKTDNATYKDTLISLRGYGNSVQALYNDRFMPIVAANQKLVNDKAAGADETTLQADRDAVAAATAKFQSAYETGEATYAPQAKDIHDFLMPGGASVLHDKGQVLMDKGYITHVDSEELRAVYDLWADYEATAALMSSFYTSLDSGDTAAQAKLDTWSTWRTAELDELPPVVPASHIIVTPNGSLEGATEFEPTPFTDGPAGDSLTYWLPISPEGKQLMVDDGSYAYVNYDYRPSTIDADSCASTGRRCWGTPSNADMRKLTDATAKASGATAEDRLTGLGGDLWHRPAFWTTDTTASHQLVVNTQSPIGLGEYKMHNAANLTGATATFGPRPATVPDYPANQGTYQASKRDGIVRMAIMESRGDKLASGVIFTHIVKDYMAQG